MRTAVPQRRVRPGPNQRSPCAYSQPRRSRKYSHMLCSLIRCFLLRSLFLDTNLDFSIPQCTSQAWLRPLRKPRHCGKLRIPLISRVVVFFAHPSMVSSSCQLVVNRWERRSSRMRHVWCRPWVANTRVPRPKMRLRASTRAMSFAWR